MTLDDKSQRNLKRQLQISNVDIFFKIVFGRTMDLF